MSADLTLLFDPYQGGHHAEYVGHLLQAWQASSRPGRLIAAVPSSLLDSQPALCEGPLTDPRIDISPLQGPLPDPSESLWKSAKANARLLRDVLDAHRPDVVCAMYLDHLQLHLAARLRPPSATRISGILFRPSLHYALRNPTVGERLRHFRKRVLLQRMAGNACLDYVFSLDHSAVPALRAQGLNAIPLPDPVSPAPSESAQPETVRSRFSFAPDRVLMVLFGALDERKGLVPLLEALSILSGNDLERVALLLAGPLAPHLTLAVRERVEDLRHRGAQVAVHDAFVPLAEIQPLIQAADLVLAPYQRHVGSSAVLIRAAAAGRPVLSQSYGYMGAQVVRHRLGRVVDTENMDALAEALRDALRSPRTGFDPAAAAAFAAANTPEAYARTILDHIAPLPTPSRPIR